MRAALCLASGVIALLLVEGGLRLFLPFSVSGIGHVYSRNAQLYGWGYGPHELVRLGDPDTGEVFTSRTNARGWRDVHHDFDTGRGTYRILCLGDSNTFGVGIPVESLYTRVLERMLRDDGLQAEVIAMAYGRWGTDQELEALRIEGYRYSPDLILLQFCANDLLDNTYFQRIDERHLKPFYYDLDEEGRLVRQGNPWWQGSGRGMQRWLRASVNHSEILKRLYGIYVGLRVGDLNIVDRLEARFLDNARLLPESTYSVEQPKIDQLQAVMPAVPEGFLAYLQGRLDDYLAVEEIDRALLDLGLAAARDTVLRVLEARWFKDWSPELYERRTWPVDSHAWRLQLALLGEVKQVTLTIGAELAVFSDTEEGAYEWERFWFRLDPSEETKAQYLASSAILEEFCERQGIGFVNRPIPHARFRNDPHPNCAGHRAMASNLYHHIRDRYRPGIGAHSDAR